MRRSTRFLPLLVTSLAFTACADAAGPAPPVAQDLDVFVPAIASLASGGPLADRPALTEEPGDDADIPEGFEESPAIMTSRVTVGFTSTRAYAQAMMRFWGNRGEQKVDLDLRYGNTTVLSRSATGRRTEIFPGVYRIDTTASVAVSGNCGHLADGVSYHDAWHAWSSYEWDRDSAQNFGDAAQPECVESVDEEVVVPGSGENDDSDWYICYYTHYYDADTGRYLYTDFHGCEPL